MLFLLKKNIYFLKGKIFQKNTQSRIFDFDVLKTEGDPLK